MTRLRRFLLNLTNLAAFVCYGLFIGAIFLTGHSHGEDVVKVKTSIDFNFWLALLAATGVPAFALWMVRSALGTVKESLAKTITVELCRANQATCQKDMLNQLGDKFAPKSIEDCIEDLRDKREVTHGRIYDEIRANRENLTKQMEALQDKIIEFMESTHKNIREEVASAIAIHVAAGKGK